MQEKIEDVLTRGVKKVLSQDLLKREIESEKISIKMGIDPANSGFHLGDLASFLKLKDFQDLGHKIILVIGDFTSQIEDSPDNIVSFSPVSEKEIEANIERLTPQIKNFLDPEKTRIYRNKEWLTRMTAKNLFMVSQGFALQKMIEREKIEDGWEKGLPIRLHELLRPLFQGYDSVAVRCDLEIGGEDQWLSLQAGREVQKFFGQKQQNLMALKTVSGLDGQKMSFDRKNAIDIESSSEELRKKLMLLKNDQVFDYFECCTRVPTEEIEEMQRSAQNRPAGLEDLKKKLSEEIIKILKE